MIKAYFSNIKDVLLQNIQFSKQSINVAVAWFTQRELFVAILDALDRGVSVSIILIDDIINRNEYGLDFSLFIRKGGNLRFADSWKSWRGGNREIISPEGLPVPSSSRRQSSGTGQRHGCPPNVPTWRLSGSGP